MKDGAAGTKTDWNAQHCARLSWAATDHYFVFWQSRIFECGSLKDITFKCGSIGFINKYLWRTHAKPAISIKVSIIYAPANMPVRIQITQAAPVVLVWAVAT